MLLFLKLYVALELSRDVGAQRIQSTLTQDSGKASIEYHLTLLFHES